MTDRTTQLTGRVVHGEKISRRTGYPTANLNAAAGEDLTIGDGVYACWVEIIDRHPHAVHPGALVIGVPFQHVQRSERKIEVHLLNFDGDLYGERLRIDVAQFLRPLLHPKNEVALRTQIEEDIALIRSILRVR